MSTDPNYICRQYFRETMASFMRQGIVVWHCGAGKDKLVLVAIGSDDLVLVKGDHPPGGPPPEVGTPVLVNVTIVGLNLRGTWVANEQTRSQQDGCDFPCKGHQDGHPDKPEETALRISRNSRNSVEKLPPVASLR